MINKDYIQQINELLANIIMELELPNDSLIFKKQDNKNDGEYIMQIFEPEYPAPLYKEVKGVTSSIMLIKEEHSKNESGKLNLSFKHHIIESCAVPNDAELLKGSGNEMAKVRISKDSPNLIPYISQIVHFRLDNYLSKASFACCSHFIDCSDAKKCVHANKLYSTGCQYRNIHLKHGKILYGKNRNV